LNESIRDQYTCMDQKNCAIIYFTRSSLSESRKKKWFNSYEKNLRFARTLISKTRQNLLDTGIDVLEIDESLQVGNTFGNRIANAFDFGFCRGYDSLILVGNDAVGLLPSHLIEAKNALENTSKVFGANSHGGAYLIGFQKQEFYVSQTAFVQLPWQTNELWEAIDSNFGTSGNAFLEILPDLNSKMDIIYLLGDVKQAPKLNELLASVVADENKPLVQIVSNRDSIAFHQLKPLRGPPVRFAFC